MEREKRRSKFLPKLCPLASNSTQQEPTEPHALSLLTTCKFNGFRKLETGASRLSV